MSLDSLIGEDTMTVLSPASTKDPAGGAVRTPFSSKFDGVPARVEAMSGGQAMVYSQLRIQATHVVYTQQGGIVNGDCIRTSDGRFLRVTDIEQKTGMGSIDTYWKLAAIQLSGSPT